jgi:hypothetical protein
LAGRLVNFIHAGEFSCAKGNTEIAMFETNHRTNVTQAIAERFVAFGSTEVSSLGMRGIRGAQSTGTTSFPLLKQYVIEIGPGEILVCIA